MGWRKKNEKRATHKTTQQTVYTCGMARKNLVNLICIIIVSLISISDLFFHQGRPITFDGHIHMTTMAQFATALKDGEFPVKWSNNFANYGLPLPLFAHQLSSYLGAFFIVLGSPVVTAYNLTLTLAVILSAVFFYLFVKTKVSEDSALIATILFTLFPYRIINMYIRGALPEILSTAFFPLLLLGIDLALKKNKPIGYVLVLLSTTLLALTHPMMLLVFGIPATLYVLLSVDLRKNLRKLILLAVSALLGLSITSYYLFPLFLEMKYFYEGAQTKVTSFSVESFLGFRNFFDPSWYYYLTHPGPRGNLIKLGIPELLILCWGVITAFLRTSKKKNGEKSELFTWSIISLVALFFVLPLSLPFYNFVPGFSSIQYPWRFLTVLQFGIPVLAALCVERYLPTHKKIVLLGLALIIMLRMPQLYGKNFAVYPESNYYFTQSNLHSQNLNTIWSDNSEKYEVKKEQVHIIEGEGDVASTQIKNASRTYVVNGKTELRLVDYTFYFPGWKVFSDSVAVPIEFQDMNYRGLITYKIPAGKHTVTIRYTDTKIRLLAVLLSGAGVFLSAVWVGLVYKKLLPINRD